MPLTEAAEDVLKPHDEALESLTIALHDWEKQYNGFISEASSFDEALYSINKNALIKAADAMLENLTLLKQQWTTYKQSSTPEALKPSIEVLDKRLSDFENHLNQVVNLPDKKTVLDQLQSPLTSSLKSDLEDLVLRVSAAPAEADVRQQIEADLAKIALDLKFFWNHQLILDNFLKLQTLITDDFRITGKKEWILCLSDQGLTNIPRAQITGEQDASLSHYSQEDISTIRKIQFRWRSNQRAKLHKLVFGSDVVNVHDLLKNVGNIAQENIKKAMGELTASYAVIKHEVHHWTVENNFHGILANKAFYGNRRLRSTNIFFQKNALVQKDVDNGDGNVICCAPFLVDSIAICSACRDIRNHLMRITLNLDNIKDDLGNNQFFKLSDFCAPDDYQYKIRLNPDLDVVIKKVRNRSEEQSSFQNKELLELSITFKGKTQRCVVNADHGIFYGNLVNINLFCLLSVYNMINQVTDESFRQPLLDYLNSLDGEEIKKIFTLIAQGLTLYSEYNFNASLRLNPGLISEVYFADTGKILDLRSLSTAEYEEAMSKLFARQLGGLPLSLPSHPYVRHHLDTGEVQLYGNVFRRRTKPIYELDASTIPAEAFNRSDYIETRPGKLIDRAMATPSILPIDASNQEKWDFIHTRLNLAADEAVDKSTIDCFISVVDQMILRENWEALFEDSSSLATDMLNYLFQVVQKHHQSPDFIDQFINKLTSIRHEIPWNKNLSVIITSKANQSADPLLFINNCDALIKLGGLRPTNTAIEEVIESIDAVATDSRLNIGNWSPARLGATSLIFNTCLSRYNALSANNFTLLLGLSEPTVCLLADVVSAMSKGKIFDKARFEQLLHSPHLDTLLENLLPVATEKEANIIHEEQFNHVMMHETTQHQP